MRRDVVQVIIHGAGRHFRDASILVAERTCLDAVHELLALMGPVQRIVMIRGSDRLTWEAPDDSNARAA